MDAQQSAAILNRFLDATTARHTLALVYGRRRIGKSTLLEALTRERHGFYWEATRGETAVQLARFGSALGVHLGVGRLAFESWEEALRQTLRLGAEAPVPVVLDEFGYLLEADSTLDSVVATLLGPAEQRSNPGSTRLVLCGSAIALMRSLSSGEAPLRGRAGVELVMQPFDFRAAATWLGPNASRMLAARVYAAIGGVIGYATDMVGHDLPESLEDFPRWVAERVLSPAATLHHEATTLLAEDPTLSAASATLHHSILGVIANGAVTAGTISTALRRPVSNLDPALKRLISAGFVVRHEDPIRARRPLYALADPFLQFHYGVLEPHGSLLRDRDPRTTWERRLSAIFDTRVRGPVFEEQARTWVRRYAKPETLGGSPDYVGPSSAVVDEKECQLDVLVAADTGADVPADRTVLAIGEAKAGEIVGVAQLKRLEQARASLGTRAASAKLLLFAVAFTAELQAVAGGRSDVEQIHQERLYEGE